MPKTTPLTPFHGGISVGSLSAVFLLFPGIRRAIHPRARRGSSSVLVTTLGKRQGATEEGTFRGYSVTRSSPLSLSVPPELPSSSLNVPPRPIFLPGPLNPPLTLLCMSLRTGGEEGTGRGMSFFLTGYSGKKPEGGRRKDAKGKEAAKRGQSRRWQRREWGGRKEREMIIHSTVITQRGTVKLTRQEIRPTDHPLPVSSSASSLYLFSSFSVPRPPPAAQPRKLAANLPLVICKPPPFPRASHKLTELYYADPLSLCPPPTPCLFAPISAVVGAAFVRNFSKLRNKDSRISGCERATSI